MKKLNRIQIINNMAVSNFAGKLLFIEPTISQKSCEPVEDAITNLIEKALMDGVHGVYSMDAFWIDSWRGDHVCCDGEYSTNTDIKLANGMITNSLAPHYARWFRAALDADKYTTIWYLAMHYNKLEEVKACTPEEFRETCQKDLGVYERPKVVAFLDNMKNSC